MVKLIFLLNLFNFSLISAQEVIDQQEDLDPYEIADCSY